MIDVGADPAPRHNVAEGTTSSETAVRDVTASAQQQPGPGDGRYVRHPGPVTPDIVLGASGSGTQVGSSRGGLPLTRAAAQRHLQRW